MRSTTRKNPRCRISYSDANQEMVAAASVCVLPLRIVTRIEVLAAATAALPPRNKHLPETETPRASYANGNTSCIGRNRPSTAHTKPQRFRHLWFSKTQERRHGCSSPKYKPLFMNRLPTMEPLSARPNAASNHPCDLPASRPGTTENGLRARHRIGKRAALSRHSDLS